jgi:hypothetical protein
MQHQRQDEPIPSINTEGRLFLIEHGGSPALIEPKWRLRTPGKARVRNLECAPVRTPALHAQQQHATKGLSHNVGDCSRR